MRSILIRLGVSAILFCAIIAWYMIPDHVFVSYADIEQVSTSVAEEQMEEELEEVEVVEETEEEEIRKSVKQSVPFIVQAPHAQWDDPLYQDACEEASILMAHAWEAGTGNISKNDAEEEFEKMFDMEKTLFGEDVVDTSIADTARLYETYFGRSVEVREHVTMEDIYDILNKNNIIIAPTNGKALGNPNFSNDGPDRHMLVIVGYDRKNEEFITNDPGTRLGRGYKYKDSTLYNAIRDYTTGHKETIEGADKTIIVVSQ